MLSDLVTSMLHVEARVRAYAVRRGTSDAQAFFAPLGYDVSISESAIAEDVTAPCDEVHHDVRLAKRLSHICVFGPVIDGRASDRMLDGHIAALHRRSHVRANPAGSLADVAAIDVDLHAMPHRVTLSAAWDRGGWH